MRLNYYIKSHQLSLSSNLPDDQTLRKHQGTVAFFLFDHSSTRDDHVFVGVFAALQKMEGIGLDVDALFALEALSKATDFHMSVTVFLLDRAGTDVAKGSFLGTVELLVILQRLLFYTARAIDAYVVTSFLVVSQFLKITEYIQT